MADQISKIPTATSELEQILKSWKWIFDPIPEWVQLDREQLKDFAKLQLDFKIKELQIEQEKLEALRNIVR